MDYNYYANGNIGVVFQQPILSSLLNNFTQTGTTTGWMTYNGTRTAELSPQVERTGVNVRTLSITTNGDYQYGTDYLEIGRPIFNT